MKFENSFTIAAPPEEAWKIVLDVASIAPCLPGATLTDQVDADTYKGQVSVKLGPVALSFKGTAQIVERDQAKGLVHVCANGADSKGRGNAKADSYFTLAPSAQGTRVSVVTDLSLAGSVAQYGRGAGLIQEVAAGMIEQFERNLNARFAGAAAGADAEASVQPNAAAPSNSIGFGLLWRIFKRLVRRAFAGAEPTRG